MLGRIQDQLPALMALAHDRSQPARLQLAGKLADLLLANDIKLNQREEFLLNELIDQLLQTKNAEVRDTLVGKFADAKRMPRKMALSIASAEISAARNVLINSETLTDADLITITNTQSTDHAAAIAERRSISEAVADALVTTGDLRVMQLVAENLGATLGPKAVGALVEAARLTDGLQHAILQRPELTATNATDLYWWLAQGLRRKALQRFSISSGQLDQALASAIDEKLQIHLLASDNINMMEELAIWLEERQAVSAKILPQILRMSHFTLFNVILSRLTQLSTEVISAVVSEPGGRTLAAICRAVGVDKPNFVSVFLLSRGARADEQIVHPRELSFALASFDRFTPAIAQDMVNNWRAHPEDILLAHERVALEA